MTGGAAVVGASVSAGVGGVVVCGSVVDVVVVDDSTVVAGVDVVVVLATVVVGAAVVGGDVPRLRSVPFESLEHDTSTATTPTPTHNDLNRIRKAAFVFDIIVTMY